jgi:Tol biopolymer transport system component
MRGPRAPGGAAATPVPPRSRALVSAVCTAAVLLLPASGAAQAGRPLGDAAYDSTFFAWERGDYADALGRLERLLDGPAGSRYLAPAAELTGEVFATQEIARDGRAVRWSPDSRYAAYEVGTGAARRTHIIAVESGGASAIAVVTGSAAAFDGLGRVAYVGGSPSEVVVRDLASGGETRVAAPGIAVQSIAWRSGDRSVYVVAPTAGGASDIFRLGAGEPERITRGQGTKTNPVWLAGERVLYTVDRQNFVIEDLRSGAAHAVSGTGVTVSADGGTIAWISRDGDRNVISVTAAAGDLAPRAVVRTADALSSPALSRSGRLLAYQGMPREDWELYVVDVASGEATRLTREIQHDVLPRFVDESTVFALMGEPRHRRSYLYDVASVTRTRLFHNNTVRTVAPEYEWEVSPDGTKVLFVADRDGDTVSPERGVYLMDLSRRVTLDEVRARVRAQLTHETELRRRGAQLFAGLEERVRPAVADVSKDRAYRYSYDLYQFDSKYITQPGNLRAIEYLVGTLRQWGYEAEVQWFETRPRAVAGGQARPVRTANVIAKLAGTVHPDVLYVVSSHFDSVERGPGADDNTSGTAALLEVARVLATRPQPATIHFAFFTGEEAGLLGSREYVRRAVENGDLLVGALNNDMIGFANDQRLDNTIRYSNDGIRDIQHAAAFLFTDLITYDAKYYRSTDAHAYYEAYGDIVGGIGSYPILGNPHYHQTHDQLETINHQLVAEVAKTTAATLIQLTNVPSRPKVDSVAVRSGSGIDVRWHPLPETDVTGYIVEVAGVDGVVRSTQRTDGLGAFVAGYRPGEVVSVWAVNARGARSWDALRVRIE